MEMYISISDTSLYELNLGVIQKLSQQPRRINLHFSRNKITRFFAENKDDVLNTTEAFPRASLGSLELDMLPHCNCQQLQWITAWRARAPTFVPTLCQQYPLSAPSVADVLCSPLVDLIIVDEESKRSNPQKSAAAKIFYFLQLSTVTLMSVIHLCTYLLTLV
ncbi:chaoptin-like [Tropilaelaps mercedesae]|uniref:Chaoptin-like n=1 Tax=Tropilaelaps mercedesae TaxID=418985 RepID=A0A1V9Y275_9ACAR|nr:chaoptin-like [Tropilaelaps mercedesae]